jgi:site-specific DNA-methyltransferase (adenine-specific)
MTPFYQDEAVTIHHGEALEVLRALPSASVDALVTDPPYSSGGAFRGDRMGTTNEKYMNTESQGRLSDFSGDNRDQRGFLFWCTLWLSECRRILKPGAPVVLFTDWRQLPITTDALQAGGFIWRGIVPWDKTEGTRPQKGRFRAQAEYAVWGNSHEIDLGGGAISGPIIRGTGRVRHMGQQRAYGHGRPRTAGRVAPVRDWAAEVPRDRQARPGHGAGRGHLPSGRYRA